MLPDEQLDLPPVRSILSIVKRPTNGSGINGKVVSPLDKHLKESQTGM
jgi:hypothetical protein